MFKLPPPIWVTPKESEIFPINSFLHGITMSIFICFSIPFWLFLPNPGEDKIIKDKKYWNIWWLTQGWSKCVSASPLITMYSFPDIKVWIGLGGTQNLAGGVKWTVIKMFKTGTVGEIVIWNEIRVHFPTSLVRAGGTNQLMDGSHGNLS